MHEDIELLNIFLRISDIIKPEISIEVGGFDSVYSQQISEKEYCNEVYSYEANPHTYNKFKDSLSKKIKFSNLAISSYEGYTNIIIQDPENLVLGHYSIKNRNQESDKAQSIEIKCNYLDNLHKFTNEKVAMWIDCEGANREVLTGAKQTLKNTEIVLIETEIKSIWQDQWIHQDVLKYMNENDFFLYKIKRAYGIQTNAIFIKNKWKKIIR